MGNLSIKTIRIKDFFENPNVLSLYEDPYGYVDRFDEKWLNFIKLNPFAKKEDLICILSLDESKIVGSLFLYPGIVKYNRVEERMYIFSSFFLKDKYRNSGAGGLMILNAINFHKCLLASGAPSEETQKLYKGTGFVELGPLKRYVYFYNMDIILKKYISNVFWIKILSLILTPLIKLFYKSIRIVRMQNKLEFLEVDTFEPDLNTVFDNVSKNLFPRNTYTLNWILSYPYKNYAFQIYKDGKIIGYCVYRIVKKESGTSHTLPEMNVGTCLDYYIDEFYSDFKESIITFGIDFFKKKNVDIFEFQGYEKEICKYCRKYGMIHLGGNKVFFRPKDVKSYDKNKEWFISHGTGDVMFLGY